MPERIEKYTYSWVLHRFSKLSSDNVSKAIYSPIFSEKGKKYEMQLEVYPNNLYENRYYVSFYLCGQAKYGITVHFILWARNSEDDLLISTQHSTTFQPVQHNTTFHPIPHSALFYGKSNYGYFNKFGNPKFIERSNLILLKDDILKVGITISIDVWAISGDLNFLKNQIVNDFQTAVENKILVDFVLKAGKFELPVHKFVLAARSTVFLKMFENDTLEKKEGYVQISDVDPETLAFVVNFMYKGELKNWSYEEARKLFYAADKYNLIDLMKACENCLVAELRVPNVIDALNFADVHNAQVLKTAATNFIVENYWNFLNIDFIPAIKSQKVLCEVLLERLSEVLSEGLKLIPRQTKFGTFP